MRQTITLTMTLWRSKGGESEIRGLELTVKVLENIKKHPNPNPNPNWKVLENIKKHPNPNPNPNPNWKVLENIKKHPYEEKYQRLRLP